MLRNKSSLLILIVACLIVVLSSGGVYTIYLTNTIKPDAEIINKLGIIRGSIQRLVKLEIAGIGSDESVSAVDSNIRDFSSHKIQIYDTNGEIQRSLNYLSEFWLELKEQIFEYRKDKSEKKQNALLEKSEEIWDEANSVVLVSQIVSERKVASYQVSYILFIINLVLGVIIIFLMKKYVKDILEHLVNYDELTKVYNRRCFNELMKNEIAKAERYNKVLSIIMYDIDHFKNVNDTYGHDVGDSVLKELSALIQSNIRKSDMLFRLGGEEFAIIAPETDIDNALVLSEKIRKIVENHKFRYVGENRISLGITQFISGDNLNSIFKRADSALYKAKEGGRNRSEIKR